MLTTTVTAKGQVTLPRKVREAAGLKPGDEVEVRSTGSGAVVIQKHVTREFDKAEYEQRLRDLAKRRIIRDITTEEFMELTRGEVVAEPDENPRKKR